MVSQASQQIVIELVLLWYAPREVLVFVWLERTGWAGWAWEEGWRWWLSKSGKGETRSQEVREGEEAGEVSSTTSASSSTLCGLEIPDEGDAVEAETPLPRPPAPRPSAPSKPLPVPPPATLYSQIRLPTALSSPTGAHLSISIPRRTSSLAGVNSITSTPAHPARRSYLSVSDSSPGTTIDDAPSDCGSSFVEMDDDSVSAQVDQGRLWRDRRRRSRIGFGGWSSSTGKSLGGLLGRALNDSRSSSGGSAISGR